MNRSNRQSKFLLFPAVTVFLYLSVLPLAVMFVHFIKVYSQEPSRISNLLLGERQLILMSRSLRIAAASTGAALAIGFPVGFVLSSPRLPVRKLFVFLMCVPVLVPPYVLAGAWVHLLSPSGWLNESISSLGLHPVSVYNFWGVAWCLGLSFFPVAAFVCATGFLRVDMNLVDAARVDCKGTGVFRHAIWPQVKPHVLASSALVFIFVLAQYSVPSLLGVNTYPVEIFAQFSAFYDEASAVALSLPLAAVAIVLVLVQKRIMQQKDYVAFAPRSESKVFLLSSRKTTVLSVLFLCVIFFTAIFLPFTAVFVQAGGLEQVGSVLNDHRSALQTTSLLALSAALLATAIAYCLGLFLARSHKRSGKCLDVLSWLPIAVPGTVLALGLIGVFKFLPDSLERDSFGIYLLLAYVGMFSAFAVRVMEASFRHADRNVDDLAAMDCGKWYQRFVFVRLPLHAPAILASLAIVFVLVLGELNATVLLVPPGKETLSVSIDNLLHYGASATASALCLIEAGLVIGVAVLMLLAIKLVGRIVR